MNIKSEAKVNQGDSGQGSTGIGQGADEPVKWGKIRREVATWIGELIDIRWDKGQGTAKLEDVKDENGEPVEKEVPCTFCFCGQHWPFNSQAYQAEDPRSHSAFAFFIHDRALLVQRKPHAGEVDEDGDGWIYEAVAVITEKKDENGEPITDPVTGIVQNEVARRWCWPLFRNGHRSFLVNACYNYDPEQNTLVGDPFTAVQNRIYRGYPFVDIDTREPVEPFVDQQGNERPLGTVGFQGNPCLLVTKEQQVETLPDGTQTPMVDSEGEPVWCYVPHAHCEFCDPWGKFIQYVPDVTMRRRPNWKGRIVGLSELDELLIDNIPVARITFDDSEIQASYSAVIRWVFHINDETNRLTLLRITADWQYAYRLYPEFYKYRYDVIFPRYAFATQVAIIQLDELNIYSKEIAEKPRGLLEEIQLVLDENMSWRHVAAYNSIPNRIDWALLDNIVSPYSTAKAPSLDGEIPGIDVPVSLYVAVIESDIGNAYKRKISLIVGTDGEGNCMVTKEVGDIDGTISNMSASDFSTVWDDTTERISIIDSVTQTIARAEEKWLEEVIVQTPSGEEEKKTAVLSESREFIARVVGHEFSRRGEEDSRYVDDEMTISYLHREAEEEFEIATMRQIWKNNRVTLIVIIFTGIDVENGVYSFWEWTLFDDIDLDVFKLEFIDEFIPNDDGGGSWKTIRNYPQLNKKVIWRHYVVDKNTRTMTHEFKYDSPSGRDDEMSDDDKDSAASLYVFWRMVRWFWLYDKDNSQWNYESSFGARAFILPHFIDGEDRSLAASIQSNLGTEGYGIERAARRMNFIQMDFVRWLFNTTMYGGLPGGTSTMQLVVDKTERSLFPGFNLHPFSDKEPGTWPYWKNAGNSLIEISHVIVEPLYWGDSGQYGEGKEGGEGREGIDEWEKSVVQTMIRDGTIVAGTCLANILYTDSMERHGLALEPGLWWYSFKVKGSEENPVVVKSAEMDKMVSCTGRNDMMFTLDCYVTLQP